MPEQSLHTPSANRVRLREAKFNAIGQVVDLLLIWLSMELALWAYPPAQWSVQLNVPAAIAIGLFCLVGHARGLYRRWWSKGVWSELREVWTSWALVVPVLMLLGFVTKTSSVYSRVMMITWFVSAPLAISVYRVLLRKIATATSGFASVKRRVAIVGLSSLGAELAQQIRHAPQFGLSFTGIYDDRQGLRDEQLRPGIEPPLRAGDLEELIAAARECAVDVVYIALPLRAEHRIHALIRRLQDTTASVYLAFDFGKLVGARQTRLRQIGDVPVIALAEGARVPWSRRRQRFATLMMQLAREPFRRSRSFEDVPERSSVRLIRSAEPLSVEPKPSARNDLPRASP